MRKSTTGPQVPASPGDILRSQSALTSRLRPLTASESYRLKEERKTRLLGRKVLSSVEPVEEEAEV